jgi:hypothetical protein
VLIVLFLTLLSASLVPLRLLDPAGQLQVGAALINASPFPLIGLGALQLACVLDPADPQLRRRSVCPPPWRVFWPTRAAPCM